MWADLLPTEVHTLLINGLHGLRHSLTACYWLLNWWLVCCVGSALLFPHWYVLIESVRFPSSGPTPCQTRSAPKRTATAEAAAPTTSGRGASWAPRPTSDHQRPTTGLSCKTASIITRGGRGRFQPQQIYETHFTARALTSKNTCEHHPSVISAASHVTHLLTLLTIHV